MKQWNAPQIKELDLDETQYGTKYSSEFDGIRVDQNGNYWVTFIS